MRSAEFVAWHALFSGGARLGHPELEAACLVKCLRQAIVVYVLYVAFLALYTPAVCQAQLHRSLYGTRHCIVLLFLHHFGLGFRVSGSQPIRPLLLRSDII